MPLSDNVQNTGNDKSDGLLGTASDIGKDLNADNTSGDFSGFTESALGTVKGKSKGFLGLGADRPEINPVTGEPLEPNNLIALGLMPENWEAGELYIHNEWLGKTGKAKDYYRAQFGLGKSAGISLKVKGADSGQVIEKTGLFGLGKGRLLGYMDGFGKAGKHPLYDRVRLSSEKDPVRPYGFGKGPGAGQSSGATIDYVFGSGASAQWVADHTPPPPDAPDESSGSASTVAAILTAIGAAWWLL